MSAGDRWRLPGGHEAIELDGSTRDVLRVARIVPHWPFPAPPQDVARSLCERMPSRYLRGAVPRETRRMPDGEEALL
jgi:hypothetical protein